MHEGTIDTWDYAWTATVWKHDGLTATPNVNLISNIGFDANATHTTSAGCEFANMTVHSLDGGITHPPLIEQCLTADKYVFFNHFIRKYKGISPNYLRLFLILLSLIYGKLKKTLDYKKFK
jgi:hypothetical protein